MLILGVWENVGEYEFKRRKEGTFAASSFKVENMFFTTL